MSGGGETEREKDTERERHRERKTQRDRERERDTEVGSWWMVDAHHIITFKSVKGCGCGMWVLVKPAWLPLPTMLCRTQVPVGEDGPGPESERRLNFLSSSLRG